MTIPVDEILRVEGGAVLATLIRLTGDFQLAEDALQEAILSAWQMWEAEGPPDNPAAWLTTVARNRALDRLRRESRRRQKELEAMAILSDPPPPSPFDDQLRLMFTCCHPALAPEVRVALTLRTISGLSTNEIARAFLVSDATMGQRLSRAKKKITVAAIPYRIPEDHELPDRLPAVLACLYLIFTTAHHAPTGRLDARIDLADEAIRLTRILVTLMPDEPEAKGLLSLMLATHARRNARLDQAGRMVLLDDQDRSLWDPTAVSEALWLITETLAQGRPGPYQVQAAIACLHVQATSDADTDWPQIADLYRFLVHLTPTAVVSVNRAVAEAKVWGPARGLERLDTVRGLETWHLYWSTRADLERQMGHLGMAADAYRQALACEMNDTDREFLKRRLLVVTQGSTAVS